MQNSVEVTQICKRFARTTEANPTLRDLLARPWRLFAPPKTETFLALDDVTFTVQPGECVGVLGKNGAGKSTLLKVLSRVTPPSAGRAVLRGRTASLLEVGTGFHPELSGRENIYLSGSILGMSRQELREHFDKIVEFSGIAPALDTPVKRYSSGMYLRLAFAVAAHLPAEIVFLDEILAVGDAEFQKKCFGSMSESVRSGRTIFFVSHNLAMVNNLCPRSIVLRAGRVAFDGPTKDAVRFYQDMDGAERSVRRPAQANGNPTIVAATVETEGHPDDLAVFRLEIEAARPTQFSVEFRIVDDVGTAVAMGALGFFNHASLVSHQGRGREIVRVGLATGSMATGRYRTGIDLALPGRVFFDRYTEGLPFEVVRAPKNGDFIVPDQSWRIGSFQVQARRLD